MQQLRGRGWVPGYVAIRSQADLAAPQPGAARVVLADARLGAWAAEGKSLTSLHAV